ncbi:MAG TPA: hypothetical protein PK269_05335 [Bacteroidales bacterium]|nr:hypothetical protein [Bacteroidales bacterium]
MKKFLFIIFILYLNSCNSQIDENLTKESSGKAYLKEIFNDCPKADIVEIVEEEDMVEVEYLCDGQRYEAGISDGKLLYKETAAEHSTIPFDKIQRKLEKKFPGWKLDEISLVTAFDTSFLKVEIIKEGFEQNVYFTSEGKWFKAKTFAAAESWTEGNLKAIAAFRGADYNFLHPDETYEMPDLLNEISGIAAVDKNTLMCVQDELGAVIEYHLGNEEIKNVYRFTDVGDFEDIAINNSRLYVLRSDGNVFDFDYKIKRIHPEQKMLSVSSLNIEGMFYNNKDGFLYLANKESNVGTDESKRDIFRYKEQAWEEPEKFLEVDVKQVNEFFAKKYPGLAAKEVAFNPSAIAIHPITEEFYILSSINRMLAVFGNKKLKNIYPLPANLYFKPEGLTFFDNGDLLIASEGDKKGLVKGYVMYFKYQKK